MQNQGPPYQGPVNHGTFPDHTYNNQMGTHCPPSGYQPYMNGPYNVNNPRAHHYGNHQMQPRPPNHQMPYRGNYAPPPNQYGPASNQDMYRNHHSTYVGGNNRAMHAKPVWGDNSPADMMPSYNHTPSHPQIMNNSTSMNVSSMRSPPHLTSVPSPGSQHYRQMQSPGHSPQTWPQVQVPSPGMHPVARTTPSPLQTHVRSPGHSQPFSPSGAHMPAAAAVNMPSHSISSVPENPQPAQMVNQGLNSVMSAGPLHSLQKMVMLEQNADAMQLNCDLPTENNCDQLSGCSSNSIVSQAEHNSQEESKDSSFATYYNLDENCLESEPHNSMDFKPLEYNDNASAGNVSAQAVVNKDSSIEINENVGKTVQPSHEAPFPITHVDSVPLQIENNPVCPDPMGSCAIPVSKNEDFSNKESADSLKPSDIAQIPNQESSIANEVFIPTSNTSPPSEHSLLESDIAESPVCEEKPSTINLQTDGVCKTDKETEQENLKEELNSIVKENDTEENQNLEITLKKGDHNVPNDIPVTVGPENFTEPSITNALEAKNTIDNELSSLKTPALRTLVNTACTTSDESSSTSSSNGILTMEKTRIADIAHNPVKVVIHRIRTNNTNDTWHVPKSNGVPVVNKEEVPSTSGSDRLENAPKFPKVGPQIIMLSPAMSKKKFGAAMSNNSETVDGIKSENSTPDTISLNSVESIASTSKVSRKKKVIKKEPDDDFSLKSSPNSKKRGRPTGSANKGKPIAVRKKRNGKQKNFKKAIDMEDVEAAPKPKKLKPFNGPYLRIIGSKQNPSSITVVNMAIKEEKELKPVRTVPVENVKRPRVGHTSTLSPHYDAFNKDRTWLCAFCHKGSHCSGLGDLYGPYYVNDDGRKLPRLEENSISSTRGIRGKRRKSDGTIIDVVKTPSPRRTMKQNVKQPEQKSTPISLSSSSNCKMDLEQQAKDAAAKEVWLHEDCAVWCQSVSLMGSQIHGLEEAIQEAKQNVCSACKFNGATLGCWCKGCMEQYHFCCAKEKGCKLDIENFSLFCPKHKDSRCLNRQKRTVESSF